MVFFDKTLDRILKELMDKDREVRIIVDGTMYNGKIHSITKNYICLSPYFVGESIIFRNKYLERIRIEEDIALPIRKKDIKVPMALKKGYLEENAKNTNQHHSQNIKDEKEREELFKDYLIHTENIKKDGSKKNLVPKGKIGFI